MIIGIWSIIRDSYFAFVESGIVLAPSLLRSSIPLDVTAEMNLDIHKLPKISHGGNYWTGYLMTFDSDPELSNGPKYYAWG